MAHVILTGCTGTAGASMLAQCIKSSKVSRVSILSRRPVKQAEGQDKVKVHIHKDFNSYPDSLLRELEGAVGCIWALGISVSQVKPDEYRTITYDYTLAAAKAFAPLNPAFNFVYISGEGATRTPGRFTQLFARVKGEAETALLALRSEYPGLRIWNVRPAFIDESQNPLKDGPDIMLKKVFGRALPLFRTVWPRGVTPAGPLAELLESCTLDTASKDDVKARVQGKGVTVEEGDTLGVLLTNTGIRRLAGL
ncbi:MAG: hypothetical protein LQ349_004167 [Xanthoria aureola]|nr:MAG: hypothetical protein LQ349_004167 [Xanthoria aureola]